MTSFVPGVATSPDNMPGSFRPPPPPPPSPTTPAPNLPAGLTASQTAEATDRYARDQFEGFRRALPPELLPSRAREFAATAAARAADDAVEGVRARHAQIGAQIDRQRAGLAVAMTPEAQTFAQRWLTREKPLWDRLDSGQLAAALREAVASANPATLAVIGEEAPAYLQSRGLNADVILEPALR